MPSTWSGRDAIRRNHTGTHVLHWALRKVLGENVKQQGSLVEPDRLRFDFGPSDAVTGARRSRRSKTWPTPRSSPTTPVRHYETTKAEAANLGAIAFFGDKYGDIVRVLEAGRNSIELCGGTHVRALGDIGPVKIVSESSIGANLRRVEAVTGTGPIERLRERSAASPSSPTCSTCPSARSSTAPASGSRRSRRCGRDQGAQAPGGGRPGIVAGGQGGRRGHRRARRRPRARHAPRHRAGAPGQGRPPRGGPRHAPDGGGAALVAAVTPDSGFDAATLLEEAKKLIKGGGGKDPLLAVAGGKDADGIDAALDERRAAAGIGGREGAGLDLGSQAHRGGARPPRRIDGHALRGGRACR